MPITSRKKFGWIAWVMFIAMAIEKVVAARSMKPRWTCASLRPSDSDEEDAVVSGACPGTAAAVVLLIGMAGGFFLTTQAGLQMLVWLSNTLLDGKVHIASASGSLAGSPQLNGLRVSDGIDTVMIKNAYSNFTLSYK